MRNKKYGMAADKFVKDMFPEGSISRRRRISEELDKSFYKASIVNRHKRQKKIQRVRVVKGIKEKCKLLL